MRFDNIATEMHEALKEQGYINQWGMVTVKPGEGDQGNGLLQTGLMYCIKANHGALMQTDVDNIIKITEGCRHAKFPILYRSFLKKNKDDGQNWDDYFGWLAACYFAGLKFPVEFFGFGQTHGWSIDVRDPEKWHPELYFERMPGFVVFAKMCMRAVDPELPITPREHIELALKILVACFSVEASDGCMKDYCVISVARRESWLCKFVSDLFMSRLRKRYKITGQAFAAYLLDPAHPLAMGDWR